MLATRLLPRLAAAVSARMRPPAETSLEARLWFPAARMGLLQHLATARKPHGGFAMRRARQSRWSIADAKRSRLDRTQAACFSRLRTGHALRRTDSEGFLLCLDSAGAQRPELPAEYGGGAGIGLGGEGDRRIGHDLPGHNTAGASEDLRTGLLSPGTCHASNGARGHNANLLPDVGTTPSGRIPPGFAGKPGAVGEGTPRNSGAIEGRRGGPIPPRPWCATPGQEGKIDTHVLGGGGEPLALPEVGPIRSARMRHGGAKAGIVRMAGGMVLRLSAAARGPAGASQAGERTR